MIRGNELAIDLGLEVLLALKPGEAISQIEVAAWCDAAREVLGVTTKPFQHQDLYFLEQRAIAKLRTAATNREPAEQATNARLSGEQIVRLTDRKARYGRRGLPEHIVRAMIA